MEPSQNKVIRIPLGFSAAEREAIGEDILRKIRSRTESGIDINGNLFASYSRDYEKTGTVDLRFSGNMMAGLEVINHGDGFIIIGFPSRDDNDKASYNQNPRGAKSFSPARKFVGISQSDLNAILERY